MGDKIRGGIRPDWPQLMCRCDLFAKSVSVSMNAFFIRIVSIRDHVHGPSWPNRTYVSGGPNKFITLMNVAVNSYASNTFFMAKYILCHTEGLSCPQTTQHEFFGPIAHKHHIIISRNVSFG